MRIDALFVVICEWAAAITWLLHFSNIREKRFQLFAFYLLIIAIIETMNFLLYPLSVTWANNIVNYFNPPLQFIFLITFLLFIQQKRLQILSLLFVSIYVICYLLERSNIIPASKNYDSFSYGIGSILLLSSVFIKLFLIFKNDSGKPYKETTMFWILLGLIIFYMGSAPYYNFKSFLWSNKTDYSLAWALHYLSQLFACIMYLIFAYSIKWKIK